MNYLRMLTKLIVTCDVKLSLINQLLNTNYYIINKFVINLLQYHI